MKQVSGQDETTADRAAAPIMAFEFTATRDQNAEVFEAFLRADPEYQERWAAERVRRRVTVAGIWAIVALFIVALPLFIGARALERSLVTALCVFGIPYAVYMLGWVRLSQYVASAAARDAYIQIRKKQWRLGQSTRVTVEGEGVRSKNTYGESLVCWRAISDCHASPAGVCIHTGRLDGMCIPACAFADPAEMEAMVACVRERRLAAGGDADAVAARVLASHDVSCAGCGYQMRGLGMARCPECGMKVDVELLLRLEERRRL